MVYPGYGSTTLWSRWRAGGSGGRGGRRDFLCHLLLPRLEPCLLASLSGREISVFWLQQGGTDLLL